MNPTNNETPTIPVASASDESNKPAEFYQIAKRLVERGFSIIPLLPKQKKTVVGTRARSRDLAQVAAWANESPNGNVGICADENFTLLETDDEQWLREKILAMTGKEIPLTLTSGSGKPNRVCRIFARTAACGNTCLEVGGKFEFRNINQYVAAPGSIHPEGLVYHWIKDVPVVAIPDWLMDALRELDAGYSGEGTSEHIQTGPAATLLSKYRQHCNAEDMFGLPEFSIAEGEGHYTLMSVAGFLHDGEREKDDAVEILQRLRDDYYQGDKGNEEIERIVDHVWDKDPCHIEPNDLPSYCIWPYVFRDAETMAEWVKENIDTLDIKAKPAAEGGLLIDYDNFLAEEIEPRRPLLIDAQTRGEIFLSSSINQIFAYRGIGKTAVTQAIVKALVHGGVQLKFHSPGKCRVVLVDGELPAAQLQERCRLFIGHGNGLIRLVTRERSKWFPKLSQVADQGRFIAEIESFAPDVIVFDTLSSVFRFDTNDAEAWDAANEFLTELRSKGYCVILIHHAGKNGSQRGRTDGDDRLDVAIKLEAPEGWEPGQGLAFDLSYEKVRHGAFLKPFSARFTEGQWEIAGRTKDVIAESIRTALNEGKSIREVAKEFGISPTTVWRASQGGKR